MSYSSTPLNVTLASQQPNGIPICQQVLLNLPPGYLVPANPTYSTFMITFLVLYEIYWLSTCLWFVYLARTWSRLRQRGVGWVIMQSAWLPIPLIVGPLRDAVGREKFNCTIVLWWRMLFTALLGLGLGMRLAHAYNQVKLHTQVSKMTVNALDEMRHVADKERRASGASVSMRAFAAFRSSGQNSSRSLNIFSPFSSNAGGGAAATIPQESAEVMALRRTLRRAGTAYQIQMAILTIVPVLIILAVLTAVEPQYANFCYGCQMRWWEYLLTLLCIGLTFPNGMRAIMLTNRTVDPLGIYHELKISMALATIIGAPGLLLLLTDEESGIMARNIFNPEWLIFLACLPLHICAVPYQIYLTVRYRLRNEDSKAARLEDTLRGERQGMFLQHCIYECCSELVRFWDEVDKFKTASTSLTAKEKSAWAFKIWQVFVANNSILQVNLGESQRNRVARALGIAVKRATLTGRRGGVFSSSGSGDRRAGGSGGPSTPRNAGTARGPRKATVMSSGDQEGGGGNNTVPDEIGPGIFDEAIEETLKMLRDPFARFQEAETTALATPPGI